MFSPFKFRQAEPSVICRVLGNIQGTNYSQPDTYFNSMNIQACVCSRYLLSLAVCGLNVGVWRECLRRFPPTWVFTASFYGGRKVQIRLRWPISLRWPTVRFLSYAGRFLFFAHISLLRWPISLLRSHFSPTLADFSPTLVHFSPTLAHFSSGRFLSYGQISLLRCGPFLS